LCYSYLATIRFNSTRFAFSSTGSALRGMNKRTAVSITSTGISIFLAALSRSSSTTAPVAVFGFRSISTTSSTATSSTNRIGSYFVGNNSNNIPRGGGGLGSSSSSTATTTTTTTTSLNMSTTTVKKMTREEKAIQITGLPLGPYPVGVTTVQIDSSDGRDRGLQTEIWYPATDDALLDKPITNFSDYLGLDTALDPTDALKIANSPNAIGGYRDGLSIEELDSVEDSTWLTNAIRNASIRDIVDNDGNKWPLIIFSHGSGAYRISYSFWTEFLASHGYVVAACDHPGSARYTIVNGKVITPGGSRSERRQMEIDRPLDIIQIIDGIENSSKWNSENEKFKNSNNIDTNNVAISGMSFGGYTTAEVIDLCDPRIKAGIMMCSSMSMSGTKTLHTSERKNKSTPVMVMIGAEDTVLGDKHNNSNRQYVNNHVDGDSYLLEIKRGGHVSFTSCEMYDTEYGNGIATTATKCKSLSKPGEEYSPLDIVKQHEIIILKKVIMVMMMDHHHILNRIIILKMKSYIKQILKNKINSETLYYVAPSRKK
jgi:predicted esterase